MSGARKGTPAVLDHRHALLRKATSRAGLSRDDWHHLCYRRAAVPTPERQMHRLLRSIAAPGSNLVFSASPIGSGWRRRAVNRSTARSRGPGAPAGRP